MKELSKRILIKICSTRPYRWVVGKIVKAIMRKAAKAPEVQERIKALQALQALQPAALEEQFYACFECMVAMGNEAAKKKWVRFNPPPPETMQFLRFPALLSKLENGRATPSDIEEFRRLAEDPQWTQCPPEYKQRIEIALRTAKPHP
jgi:hypothetical protein